MKKSLFFSSVTSRSAIFQLCISPGGNFDDVIWAIVADRDEVKNFSFVDNLTTLQWCY